MHVSQCSPAQLLQCAPTHGSPEVRMKAQKILAHSRLDLRMKLYSRVTAALQREAAGKMDALFAIDEAIV